MAIQKHFVYILTNLRNTVLYIGMTDNLIERIKYHRRLNKGFSARYNVTKLVYFELLPTRSYAAIKEKQLKNLVRRKKEELINKFNPKWIDLSGRVLSK